MHILFSKKIIPFCIIGLRKDDTALLKLAANAYKATLEGLSRKIAPLGWAHAQNNLGVVLTHIGVCEHDMRP